MKSIPLLLAGLLMSLGAMAADGRTATLAVSKMDCAVCPITVRKALEKVPGVGSVKVELETRRAVVAFDPAKTSTVALTRATADAGFPSSAQQVR
jgi:periplasmic mercuric ion binding protein